MADAGNGNDANNNRRNEPETFSTNPYSADINPSDKKGATLYLNATKGVAVDSQLDLSINKQQDVLDHLRNAQAQFGWGKVTSKVPCSEDNNATQYDVLQDINKLTQTLVRKYTSGIFYRHNSRDLPDATGGNLRTFDIDPQTNNEHKQVFYQRVRCNMIGTYLLTLFKPKSLLKLTQKKHMYTWRTSDGEVLYDGVLMLQIIMDHINPSTKVGVSSLKDKIRNAKLANHSYNVSSLTEHIENTYQEILARGSTHEDITKDLFEALGSGKNDEFNSFISTKKNLWETGTEIDPSQLMTDAVTIYNNLHVNNKWNTKSKSDDKIVALTTQVSKLQDQLSKVQGSNGKSNGSNGEKMVKLGKFDVEAWRLKRGDKSKTSISKGGKTWYWNPKMNSNKGLWSTKKPRNDSDDKSTSDKTSSDKSLTLSDKMKAAMVSRFKCTESEASKLWSEVCDGNENKDF